MTGGHPESAIATGTSDRWSGIGASEARPGRPLALSCTNADQYRL